MPIPDRAKDRHIAQLVRKQKKEEAKNRRAMKAYTEDTVKLNEIKKGWQVIDADATTYEVMDNKRGMLRRVKAIRNAPMIGDEGEMYAFKWVKARKNPQSPWVTVLLTEKNQREKAIVEGFGL